MSEKLLSLDRTLPTISKENRKWFDVLFKAVGKEFTNHAVTIPGWYVTASWTKQEESDFLNWLSNDMKGFKGMTKKQAEVSASWFVFNYGWKVVNAKEKV